MITFPNLLSLLRVPLALVFLQGQPLLRAAAIVLAMLTDGLDGYFARKSKQSSPLGKLIDPLTDKFFVLIVLIAFILERRLEVWEAMAMMCRDFSVILFGVYLWLMGLFTPHYVKAIWCGKITTTLQFFVLLALTFQFVIPSFIFFSFIILGASAFFELYYGLPNSSYP